MLGPRALGRAVLARQHLLARSEVTALDLIEHLVGLQAQAPWAPYTGLWTRLAGFTHADLADRILDRSAVRIVLMRGTIHLVTAADAFALPQVTTSNLERFLRTNATYGPQLRDVDFTELAAAARELLEAQPLGPAELGERLAVRWPDIDPGSLAYGARCVLPLVQIPPRAVWGRSGPTTWTTTRAFLNPTSATAPLSAQGLIVRYLGAFGPASVADAQQWSGLKGLGAVFERLRSELVTFRAEPSPGARAGRELFDLPGAPRPDADTAAPVRFLPEFDNLLVAHADRTRLVSENNRRRLWRSNGAVPGAVLVDGVAAGSWTVRREKRAAALVVEPFGSLSRSQWAQVEAEAEELVRFVADDAESHRVQRQDG